MGSETAKYAGLIDSGKASQNNARIDEIENLYGLTILGGWKSHSYEARMLDYHIDRRMRELGRTDWKHPPVPEPAPEPQESPEIIKRVEALIKERDEARAAVKPHISRERLAEMLDSFEQFVDHRAIVRQNSFQRTAEANEVQGRVTTGRNTILLAVCGPEKGEKPQ